MPGALTVNGHPRRNVWVAALAFRHLEFHCRGLDAVEQLVTGLLRKQALPDRDEIGRGFGSQLTRIGSVLLLGARPGEVFGHLRRQGEAAVLLAEQSRTAPADD